MNKNKENVGKVKGNINEVKERRKISRLNKEVKSKKG